MLAFQPREVAYQHVRYTLFTPGTRLVQSVTVMTYVRQQQQSVAKCQQVVFDQNVIEFGT